MQLIHPSFQASKGFLNNYSMVIISITHFTLLLFIYTTSMYEGQSNYHSRCAKAHWMNLWHVCTNSCKYTTDSNSSLRSSAGWKWFKSFNRKEVKSISNDFYENRRTIKTTINKIDNWLQVLVLRIVTLKTLLHSQQQLFTHFIIHPIADFPSSSTTFIQHI